MIGWQAIEADMRSGQFSYEFGLFLELALEPTLNNESMFVDPNEVVGSHNLRAGLAMGQLNKHLALAVQSIWEAAFRRYVRDCADELEGVDALRDDRLRASNVSQLAQALEGLRGLPFEQLPHSATLLEMVLVGNVVRHGDGPSCGRLLEAAPQMYLNPPSSGVDPRDVADELFVRDADIHRYAEAVAGFWHALMATYREQFPSEEPPWARESHTV